MAYSFACPSSYRYILWLILWLRFVWILHSQSLFLLRCTAIVCVCVSHTQVFLHSVLVTHPPNLRTRNLSFDVNAYVYAQQKKEKTHTQKGCKGKRLSSTPHKCFPYSVFSICIFLFSWPFFFFFLSSIFVSPMNKIHKQHICLSLMLTQQDLERP